MPVHRPVAPDDLADVDLLDPAAFEAGQPWELYRALRQRAPVFWHAERAEVSPDGVEGRGFWALTRHADVRRVSHDPVTFSAWLGATQIPDLAEHNLAQMRLMMLNMDPPEHTDLRRLVNRNFTPRQVARLRHRIDELAAAVVDEVVERGECDFVSDVAGELPSYLIAELVGIPLDDGRRLYELTEIMHSEVPAEQVRSAMREMFGYSQDLIAAKRAHPAEDLASAILSAEVAGRRLSDEEFNLFFLLLINAGGDTTRNLVAGGMELLFQHPDAHRRLETDLALLPDAVEEMLRCVSPVVHFRRTATSDTEIGGVPIAKGDKVVMFYGAANRDPDVFENPDHFDIGRRPNDHVAFGGGGAHFCLGAHLARAEIVAMFRQVLTRLVDLEPAGRIERLHSVFIAGPKRMPVRFRPGRRTAAA